MARVMMTAMPFGGHVAPVRAVAGAEPVPWRRAPAFDERDLAATFPRLRDRPTRRQLALNLEDLFPGTAPAQCADLLAAYDDEPWDVLAGDALALGTRFAAERTGTRGRASCPYR
ncbi:hypothetical protein [Isoptericola variabilis]|uniref:hypothetical protein n=1 Tax=Isoptericola variabilis TaxID=139208 RepID=UPI0003005218|nr:hypothetical protein [Isoptericola variabilis]TWH28558.1 hypothetical protein L600_000400001570 [Isoptericola variabilis J7]